ncbi:MAG: NUDIX hydrolase [Paraprevotella sp.]|nr:NUDIX hydrolase [Paraprevotella sp.]
MDQHVCTEERINPHVSVDCVVLGFDGEQLKVLLVRQTGQTAGDDYDNNMKLPGSLIYNDEDLDEAAHRVLYELTGIKDLRLIQFRAFGSKNRTKNPKDTKWLEHFYQLNQKVEQIVTIIYLTMVKIDRRLSHLSNKYEACWTGINELCPLAFDHNLIISEALLFIRQYVQTHSSVLFDLLPRKFTAAEMRMLYAKLYNRSFDIRNFHKKIAQMKYVIPLEEFQTDVAHRAARYYKFDRKLYNKLHGMGKSYNEENNENHSI